MSLNSSIFFPNQINTKLDIIVAEAYIEPNCPCVIFSSFLILVLINLKKTLSKIENVNIKPNKIIFLFKIRLLFMSCKVAFIGLGVMIPMAGYISKLVMCNCL